MATQITLARHRAPLAHSQKSSRSQVPAFLQKLYEMLNDPNNFHLIRWSEAGDSFIVPNHEQFAREVLGRWFKHQNFSSFVRQLNMYGFHKIPQLQQGVLKSDSDIEIWTFAHPHFRRGEPHLLNFIQRKKQAAQTDGIIESVPAPGVIGTIDFHDTTNGASGAGTPTPGQVLDVQSIVNGISVIKRHQTTIQGELAELKQSNQMLWQDAMDVRAKYQKQQDTINRIVKFLAGVFGNRASPHKDGGVDTLDSRAVIPRRRTRLLIENGQTKKVGVTEMFDEDEDEAMEAQLLGTDAMNDYPFIETPASAPSPALSDTPSLSITEASVPFGSYNPTQPQSQPTPTTNGQQPPPPPYPNPTQPTQPTHSQPQPQQPQQHTSDRTLTPSRSQNVSPSFDLQQVLNQLSPQQIQQLFSLSFPPLDSLPDGHGAPPSSSPSQLTSYQPPPFDFSHLTQPSSKHDHDHDLISFDPATVNLGKQWKAGDDLDKEVNMLGSSIHSFMQEMQDMGLDPQHLDASAGASLLPMLDPSNEQQQQQQQQHPSLHPLTTQLPTHLTHSQPPSNDPSSTLLQVPPVPDPVPTNDDDFDMYSFLNLGRDTGHGDDEGVGADVDGGDPSTAFLDNVQGLTEPKSRPERIATTTTSPVGSRKSGGGGDKRKSDVALGEVPVQLPVLVPEQVLGTQPIPKRGGVKMDMNGSSGTGTRPVKRKRDK